MGFSGEHYPNINNNNNINRLVLTGPPHPERAVSEPRKAVTWRLPWCQRTWVMVVEMEFRGAAAL